MTSIGITVSLLLVITATAGMADQRGLSNAIDRKAPDTVAQAMVKAFRNHRTPDKGSLESMQALAVPVTPEEDAAINKTVETALALTGEQVHGASKLDVYLTYRVLFFRRRPITAAVFGKYEARLKLIDRATLRTWAAAQSRLDRISGHTTSNALLVGMIVFNDFLFESAAWKKGNPDQTLTRLASLPDDAVRSWHATVRHGMYGDDPTDPFAAWALVAVNELFAAGAFQQSLFDSAAPLAESILSTCKGSTCR